MHSKLTVIKRKIIETDFCVEKDEKEKIKYWKPIGV